MTIKDFLKQYAERFPDKINFGDTEKFVEKTNMITFDYTDGLITFFSHGVDYDTLDDTYDITGSGGDNSCNFYDTPEYKFIWENLIVKESRFKSFLDRHNMTDEDLMVVIVKWFSIEDNIGCQEIECNFEFYEFLDEKNYE